MTVAILELLEKDLDDIVKIEKEVFSDPWEKEFFEYELFENPFSHYFKMIIKETNEILGYIGFWITFETAQIANLAIAKKYQGRKLSKLLLADCIKRIELANCEKITLEVRVSNEKAINLYKSFGFVNVTVRKHYYNNGEDAYLMLKELNNDNTSN